MTLYQLQESQSALFQELLCLRLQLVRKLPSFNVIVSVVWLWDKIAPQRHHKTHSQLLQLHFQQVQAIFPLSCIHHLT